MQGSAFQGDLIQQSGAGGSAPTTGVVAYWVVYDVGGSDPTGAQIRAGNDATDSPALASGWEVYTAPGYIDEQTLITSLTLGSVKLAWVLYDHDSATYSNVAVGTVTAGAIFDASVADEVAIADAAGVVALLLAAMSETSAASDATAAAGVWSSSLAESAAATDANAAAAGLACIGTESIAASDAASAAAVLGAAVAESTGPADTPSAELPGAAYRSVEESVAVTDAAAAASVALGVLADSAAAEDASAASAVAARSLAEAVAAADVVSSTSGDVERAMYDSVSVSDAQTASAQVFADVDEFIAAMSEEAARMSMQAQLAEDLAPFDLWASQATMLGFLFDAHSVSETVAGARYSAGDAVLSDAVAVGEEWLHVMGEPATVAEGADVPRDPGRRAKAASVDRWKPLSAKRGARSASSSSTRSRGSR